MDGGLDIPRSDKHFSGYNKENESLNVDIHRKYIFRGHVAAYMKTLKEDEPELYQYQFSKYVKKGIEPESMDELCKSVYAAIQAFMHLKSLF